MALNLLRIAAMTGSEDHRLRAEKTLHYFGARATYGPLGFGALLNAYDFLDAGAKEIFIAGDAADDRTRALIHAVWRSPDPNRVVALVVPGLEKLLPPAEGKTPVDGRPAAYVCRNQTCKAPVLTLE
jgi:uncharacterized protein YyaL (SSP411 family)